MSKVKSGALGLLVGGITATPVHYFANNYFLHPPNPTGQWEYDTDMSSLEAALFAICYRYIVREADAANPMLSQGGAS